MRKAELTTAVVLAGFSLWIMYLSQIPPLQIGWIPEKGPGGGAFPFWLAAGMLLCSVAIFVRALQGRTPQSRSSDPFISGELLFLIGTSVGAIFAMLLITHFLGAYVAIFLFLLVYLKFLGNHRWGLTLAVAIVSPVTLFFFFESGMKILLPKGITEPLFFPLYKLFVY